MRTYNLHQSCEVHTHYYNLQHTRSSLLRLHREKNPLTIPQFSLVVCILFTQTTRHNSGMMTANCHKAASRGCVRWRPCEFFGLLSKLTKTHCAIFLISCATLEYITTSLLWHAGLFFNHPAFLGPRLGKYHMTQETSLIFNLLKGWFWMEKGNSF